MSETGLRTRYSALIIIILTLGMPRLVTAADRWIRVSNSQFEIDTTSTEQEARETLRKLEQIRTFFLQSSHAKITLQNPVRIIGFSSESEYRPYRLSAGSFAYYLRGRERDYIVMQDLSRNHEQIALHEYAHLFLAHSNLTLPVWLGEGLADVYSSLEVDGHRATIGRAVTDREVVLRRQPWMDWGALLAVDRHSPYYNEGGKMSIFYAQSWALTHMLVLGDRYSKQFQRFLDAVSSGVPSIEAFRGIYGKSIEEVSSDLHEYVQKQMTNAIRFHVDFACADGAARVEALSELNADIMLADLLASQASVTAKTPSRAFELERLHSFFASHSSDPQAIYRMAQLQELAGAPTSSIIDLLRRVLILDPNHVDAQLLLGLLATDNKQFELAIAALSGIGAVAPDRAYAFYSAIAYCDLNLHDSQRAKLYGQKALEYASTPEEKARAQDFLRDIEN